MDQQVTFLGRYEIGRILGRGAMGVVFEGCDPKLNRQVAVKTIFKGPALDQALQADYAQRFIHEAQAVARLNHPNIVTVFDFGNEADVAYLVMEFIQGKELKSYLDARHVFGVLEAVTIVCELLEALDYAHRQGIVHRDIKPANVMLDLHGRVKLTDFGVARVVVGADQDGSRAGTMVGSPSYMSPEQIKGAPVGSPADLFATGVLLYQCLSLHKPFVGDSEWDLWKKIVNEAPPALSTYRPDIPPKLETAILRALAKDPAQRPASARAFIIELQAAIADVFDDDATRIGFASAPRAAAGARDWPSVAPHPEREIESEFWRGIQDSQDTQEFQRYLERFPSGHYADLSRRKIVQISAGTVSPPRQALVEPSPWARTSLAPAAPDSDGASNADARQHRAPSHQVVAGREGGPVSEVSAPHRNVRRYVGAAVAAVLLAGGGVVVLSRPSVPAASPPTVGPPVVAVSAFAGATPQPVLVATEIASAVPLKKIDIRPPEAPARNPDFTVSKDLGILLHAQRVAAFKILADRQARENRKKKALAEAAGPQQ